MQTWTNFTVIHKIKMGWEGQIADTEEKINAYTFLVENSDGNILLADLWIILDCILKETSL